jgi:hypothetical protein
MEKNIDKQRSSKIIIVSILIIMLLASVFLFFDSLKMEYKTYNEISTIFKDLRKTESDGDIMIILETEEGVYRIGNIISTRTLYNDIETTFLDGDQITIYYYGTNSVLGINKGDSTILDLNYSIGKLENNDRLGIVILPILFTGSLIAIIYIIVHKKTEEESIIPEKTLKFENTSSKRVIRQKVPLYLIIFHSIVVICSILFIPYLLKVRLLYVDIFFGMLIFYNFYRFIGLFIRKIEINEFDHEMILFTPFRKKANIKDIEYINTIVNEGDEGPDRYFVEFKFKSKKRLIKFETTSDEQSNAIKQVFDNNQK